MEINSLPQACYLHDLPSVLVSGISADSIFCKIALGTNSIEETYYPHSDGKVTVRQLDTFAEDFTELDFANVFDSVSYDYIYRLKVEATSTADGTKSVETDVHPCRLKVGKSPDGKFLTRNCSRAVAPGEPVFFAFYGGSTQLIISEYQGDKLLKSTTVNNSSPATRLVQYGYSRRNFSDAATHIVARLYRGGQLTDSIIVAFRDSLFGRSFVFDNVFYAPDVFVFRGSEKEQLSYEADLGSMGGKVARLSDKSYPTYVVTSGPLTPAELDSALDLASADHPYLYVDGKLQPIVILSFEENSKRPANTPPTVTMTYRLADRPLLAVTRVSEPNGFE